MTDMEIPQAAVNRWIREEIDRAIAFHAATKGGGHQIEDHCDGWTALTEAMQLMHDDAPELLEALTERTDAEVKSMCETAGGFGRALGRKEALEEAAAKLQGFAGDPHGIHGDVANGAFVMAAGIVRSMASQPLLPASNGLTVSSRHPGTPEDTKPPQEGE